MGDTAKKVLGIYTAIIIFIFYLPLLLVIILSFKSGAKISFPIESFDLYWYFGEPGKVGTSGFTSGIFHDPYIARVVRDSVMLGIINGAIVMPLTLSAALAFRHKFAGRDMIFYLLLMGFVIPAVILGLGSNLLYKAIGIKEYSLWTVLPLHIVYTLPFGLIITMARFDPMMVEYENAARTSGANSWSVFRRITLPLIRTEASSVFFFAFTLSFSELLRAAFVVGGIGTLSTYIFNQMSVTAPTPKWFAMGTVTTALSLIILLSLAYIMSRGQRRAL
ncbi:MAG: ABC transporter permease subunit [Candidatus Bathyarchaeia archaeon]